MTDEQKTIAFVVYPGLTPLDLVGPLQVLSALAEFVPSYRTVVVGATKDTVGTDTPLRIAPSHTFDEVPSPFAVLVPGGTVPTLHAMSDENLLAWLRTAAAGAELVTSVCTGSLILGAAGLLEGKEATTHWMLRDVLTGLGAKPVARRWVEDGRVITAAGVSAGIDLALHLVERLAGRQVATNVQFVIEYDPEPPQGALDWANQPYGDLKPLRERTLREGLAGNPALLEKLLAHT
ncbi:DJ-1/PfpI family protein [Amycolatopsis sp. NPDC051128]|uniref:DJ-1/PfpI family protein n=1 Tax=Amycolatopsis sp. NPDC051128 TaxID=3155412 RepID=UPI003421BA79